MDTNNQRYNYYFLLRRDFEGLDVKISIDAFMEGPSESEIEYSILTDDPDKLHNYRWSLKGMVLRLSFNQNIIQNIFKVNTEFELSSNDFNSYIESLSKENLLKFIEDSKLPNSIFNTL